MVNFGVQEELICHFTNSNWEENFKKNNRVGSGPLASTRSLIARPSPLGNVTVTPTHANVTSSVRAAAGESRFSRHCALFLSFPFPTDIVERRALAAVIKSAGELPLHCVFGQARPPKASPNLGAALCPGWVTAGNDRNRQSRRHLDPSPVRAAHK
jgi:hypothetical protein